MTFSGCNLNRYISASYNNYNQNSDSDEEYIESQTPGYVFVPYSICFASQRSFNSDDESQPMYESQLDELKDEAESQALERRTEFEEVSKGCRLAARNATMRNQL